MTERHLWDGFLGPDTPATTALPSISGSRVLITGGGGYIGSAVARALLHMGADVTLLDTAEYGLARASDTADAEQHSRLHLIVGDVQDATLIRKVLEEKRPSTIVHAAGRKYLPLLQTNCVAAVATNVLGTSTLLGLSSDFDVQQFLFLSTDKAVEPVSVMGQTKRIAEQMVLAFRRANPMDARVLRLCNVLGSTGSVAPRFARQIRAGEPLTITQPDATRFYISLAFAVDSVIQAIFQPLSTGLAVPSVSASHTVISLARWMLRAAGSAGSERLLQTGLRSGERLHEQLIAPAETIERQSGALLHVNVPGVDPVKVQGIERSLAVAVHSHCEEALSALLRNACSANASEGVPA